MSDVVVMKQVQKSWIAIIKKRHILSISNFKMLYKLEIRKSEFVNLVRDQNVNQAVVYHAIREIEKGIPCISLPKTGRPHVLSQNRVNTLVESAFKA